MKKFVSLILVVLMVVSAIPAFAQDDAENVLLKVKEKIEIPDFLTEFSYTEEKYDNAMRYDFTWSDKDFDKEMRVSADVCGNIVSYSYYEPTDYQGQRVLIDYTIDDAKILAQETVEKFFPEYFADDSKGTLVLDEENSAARYSGRYKTFVLNYDRVFDSIKVESNFVSVRIRATKDKMVLWSVDSALDETADFVPESEFFGLMREDAYEKVFPIKMYYKTDESKENSVMLCYGAEKGYVSYATGEKITEEYFDSFENFEAGATEDAAMGSASKKDDAVTLKPNEQSEIEKMASLVKVQDVEKLLRTIAVLAVADDMKISDSYTYKSDGKYFVRFTTENEERVMNVVYNGETGEVVSIYSYYYGMYEEKEKSDEAEIPTEEMAELARLLAKDKMNETEVVFADNKMTATRVVNGVAFPENRINVTYNLDKKAVTRFSIQWDDGKTEFANPDDVIDVKTARDILFEKGGLEDVWVKTSDGYRKAVTLDSSISIDAISGKEIFTYESNEKVSYTDIESHWAKQAIETLFEHDIYLAGDKFNPDSPISQADMIRLFSSCRSNGMLSYATSDEEVVRYAYEQKYIEKCKADETVTRKEAFEALVNILGYGEIASFDIYKSSYIDFAADGNAEILKAMGVLNGEYARGDDELTRGEAAVMVYRYLKK